MKNLHTLQEQNQGSNQEEQNPFENIDFDKIRQVTSKSIPWVVTLLFLTSTLSFLYIRYTKPIYSSESILKLDIKSEAGILGLQNPMEQDIKGLSGEIEILRSRLFFSQVVDAVDLDISYFHPGRTYLVDERYRNSPFLVQYDFFNPALRDKKIEIEILNENQYYLSFNELEKRIFQFGERINNENFDLVIDKTEYFESQKNLSDFYFVVNSKESLIDYFQNSVTVEPVNFNANTIKISLIDYSQQKAKRLIEAIDTIYLAYTKNVKNMAGEQKIKFLEDQMTKTSLELEAYEEYFEEFTIEHRTTDLSQDLSYTISMLNKLDSQRFNIREQILNIERATAQINNNEPLTIDRTPKSIALLINDYNSLVKERELKLNDYNENTQVIQQLDNRIKLARESALVRLVSYKTNLREDLDDLKNKRVSLENNFVELPSMGTSYNKNRRLYSLQEEFYFSLIKSKIELEIAKAGTVTNFVILSPASFPVVPVHPNNLLIHGIGLTAGILFSLLFIVISYLVHDKITSQKELEKLVSAPILGVVPKYKKEKLDASRLIVNTNPKSPISESLRAIRTNMEFIASGQVKNKLISITSTVSGEGKTFIAVNLGAICAYAGQKVVIVDLDMRKPKVHLAFDADKSEKGVSTILINRHNINDCIEKSEVENLCFIQAGPTPPNPSELILSKYFDSFIDGLREKFDLIILDTPPVGLVTDGILVMKKCDLPIYVVRAEYSKKSYLKSIQRLIINNRFNHISIVLNAVGNNSGYGYGYGYGYYEEASREEQGVVEKIFKSS